MVIKIVIKVLMHSHLHLGGINFVSSKNLRLKIKLATHHQNNLIIRHLSPAGRFSIIILGKNNALNPFRKFHIFTFIF